MEKELKQEEHGSTVKWSPHQAKQHVDANASEFVVPKQLDFTKTKDAFMSQFESIADGSLDCDAWMKAGSVNFSLGKVGGSVQVDCSMNDITN